MNFSETNRYVELVGNLSVTYNLTQDVASTLINFTSYVFQVEQQNLYAEPTSWIGLSIVAASLLCIFAMAADLLHGLRNRKLWFPCKYFTINAAFLSVISAAMKLPMDTTTAMPGDVDQVTKLGSMAFLCTMMANLLPSLGTMNSKELLTNITGLGVMVITLVVNVCIQIQTGVVSYNEDGHLVEALEPHFDLKSIGISSKSRNSIIAAVYVTLLLVLLIIHISSSLVILNSKKMIDKKYQKCHEKISKELPTTLKVEVLRQHVSKYCIMAETGSPQLKRVCYVTTSTCGVICVLSTALHIRTVFWTIESLMEKICTLICTTSSKEAEDKSDYKSTMFVIFIIQFIGVILGTIVPLCRCFSVLCFEVSIESIKNHIKGVFKVESYWLEKLYDWKLGSITLPFRSHKCKVITEHVKMSLLKFCLEFQRVVVVTCKIISLVPFFMICAFYCLKCLKNKGKAVGSSKTKEESCVESRNKKKDLEQEQDLRRYVLQLQDETEISETTLKWLLRSTERLFKKGERQHSKDLLELIKKSRCFEGDEGIDCNYVTSLLSKEDQDCWSLPVVTLTTIAISLPGINQSKADELLRIVNEGLVYVKHVEQSLNTTNDTKSIQMAAGILWDEFEVFKKRFIKKMQENVSQNNKPREIIQSFKEKGEEDKVKEKGLDNGSQNKYSICRSICADSMCHITETILHCNILDDFSKQQQLFDHILQMISCVLAACLTNLPKVIVMKCHTSEIEKREDNVQEIAELLGELPFIEKWCSCLNPNDDLPFIEKWCSCLKHAYP